jgi:hypothetical protein
MKLIPARPKPKALSLMPSLKNFLATKRALSPSFENCRTLRQQSAGALCSITAKFLDN